MDLKEVVNILEKKYYFLCAYHSCDEIFYNELEKLSVLIELLKKNKEVNCLPEKSKKEFLKYINQEIKNLNEFCNCINNDNKIFVIIEDYQEKMYNVYNFLINYLEGNVSND